MSVEGVGSLTNTIGARESWPKDWHRHEPRSFKQLSYRRLRDERVEEGGDPEDMDGYSPPKLFRPLAVLLVALLAGRALTYRCVPPSRLPADLLTSLPACLPVRPLRPGPVRVVEPALPLRPRALAAPRAAQAPLRPARHQHRGAGRQGHARSHRHQPRPQRSVSQGVLLASACHHTRLRGGSHHTCLPADPPSCP